MRTVASRLRAAAAAAGRRYFDPGLGLHIQSYNLLALSGVAAGLALSSVSALIGAGAANVLINLALSVLSWAALCAGEKTGHYRFCGWVVIIAMFAFAFPVLFFTAGGYRSGMPCFFVLAINFTAVMLDRADRVAAVLGELTLYAACCLIAYYYPWTVAAFPDEFAAVLDVMTGFAVSGILLLLLIQTRDRMYREGRGQINELNRELVARNETLTRYDTMKSDFLATVAHEISTPLAVIMASSRDTIELLEEPSPSMAEVLENQQRIEKRVKLIDKIVLDLMDTAAIENGRLALRREPINLALLIRQLEGGRFGLPDTAGNTLECELPPELPDIWADPGRIEQVLTNLVSNAVRHTKGGRIVVRAARAEGGGRQTVCVEDTGGGMDGETARAALKLYVSTKPDHWRHGIGLYLCRRIIMAHGGDIWIESEKGRGTRVYFSLNETGYEDE